MRELGKKEEVLGREVRGLVPISRLHGRPTSMPHTDPGTDVVCGYDQGLGERLFLCNDLADMQRLYDNFAKGGALNICWYQAQVMNVGVAGLGLDRVLARRVIEQFAPDAPEGVKDAIAQYASGNLGAARVLSERASEEGFTDASEVTDLVGWPLSEHSVNRSVDIWDNLR